MDPRKKHFTCGVCKLDGFSPTQDLYRHLIGCISRIDNVKNHSLSWTRYTFLAYILGYIEYLPDMLNTPKYFNDYLIRRQIINIYDIIFFKKSEEYNFPNYSLLDEFQMTLLKEKDFSDHMIKAKLIPGINSCDLKLMNDKFNALLVFNYGDALKFKSDTNLIESWSLKQPKKLIPIFKINKFRNNY